jgi:hypothetical protein
MNLEGAVVCLMCGRTVGRLDRGRLYSDSSRPTLRRDGGRLRCGHCRGNLYLDVDPTVRPERADRLAEEAGLRRTRSA